MGLVGGLIIQLTVSLDKVMILVLDDSRVALICGENDDVGVGAEKAKVQIFQIWRGWGVVGGWLENWNQRC